MVFYMSENLCDGYRLLGIVSIILPQMIWCPIFVKQIMLGNYPVKLFADKEPKQAIRRFKSALQRFEWEVKRRNSNADYPYQWLLPEMIANAISIWTCRLLYYIVTVCMTFGVTKVCECGNIQLSECASCSWPRSVILRDFALAKLMLLQINYQLQCFSHLWALYVRMNMVCPEAGLWQSFRRYHTQYQNQSTVTWISRSYCSSSLYFLYGFGAWYMLYHKIETKTRGYHYL